MELKYDDLTNKIKTQKLLIVLNGIEIAKYPDRQKAKSTFNRTKWN